jgi:segregation and condensation protein B
MIDPEVRNIIEAALLAAGKSLTINDLSQLFEDSDRPTANGIRAAIEALQVEFELRAVEIKETGAGFRVQVRRQYSQAVSRLWPERPQRYSRALLETLALIAYRQPITRAEIEAVRGVTVNPNITKTLLERQWIRVVGHRDLPGRPELLGTTREFLEYFGLRSLDELPPLSELRSLEGLDPQLDLTDMVESVPGPIGSPSLARASLPDASLRAPDDQLDDDTNDADSADADDDSASPPKTSGLRAAPPDDSN